MGSMLKQRARGNTIVKSSSPQVINLKFFSACQTPKNLSCKDRCVAIMKSSICLRSALSPYEVTDRP